MSESIWKVVPDADPRGKVEKWIGYARNTIKGRRFPKRRRN